MEEPSGTDGGLAETPSLVAGGSMNSISSRLDPTTSTFGVELINSTLIGTLAQRLLRRVCPHCAADRYLTPEEGRALNLALPDGKRVRVRTGEGCFECRGTGYLGRTAIFEVLAVDDSIKHLVAGGADAPRIKREAVKNGMQTLRQAALRRLAEGVTTFEEVLRVTGS